MKISGLEYYTSISSMEPMFPEDTSGELEDLAEDLVFKALSLSGSLHPLTRAAIANVLSPMNSYYSNLIEGHDTHPIDIERALNNQFSSSEKQRSLQLEAKAHVEVQAWIRDKFKMSVHKTFDQSLLSRYILNSTNTFRIMNWDLIQSIHQPLNLFPGNGGNVRCK